AVDVVCSFMALLSFRGISTPSLTAQGEQRRSSIFNILRDIPDRRSRRLSSPIDASAAHAHAENLSSGRFDSQDIEARARVT
ncbi:hypothetical protein, partial [Methylocystis sp.]|uniref:hypothetical protein n=1 Tax=Methylocystis sp. TaxID=1911079 RepID=UPI003D14EFD5